MAKTVIATLADDIDGGTKDVSTYRFGWLGRDYEVDLSAKNFKAFDAAIAPYVQAWRIQPRGTGSRTTRSTDREYDLPALREWAASQGIELPQRGRIPQAIVFSTWAGSPQRLKAPRERPRAGVRGRPSARAWPAICGHLGRVSWDSDLARVESELNRRPGITLNDRAPANLFTALLRSQHHPPSR